MSVDPLCVFDARCEPILSVMTGDSGSFRSEGLGIRSFHLESRLDWYCNEPNDVLCSSISRMCWYLAA